METYISPIDNAALSDLCAELKKNNRIHAADYQRFEVKRGLRNADGTGVMAGLTRICSVEGYYVADGERVPKDGRLVYRGIDMGEIVRGCTAENRFGFEEVAWLLLFGDLPTQTQLERFRALLAECRELPDEFIEDMIMKAPSPDIMNKVARSVLALYSFDKNPDDTSIENVLRQSIQLIAQIPTLWHTLTRLSAVRMTTKVCIFIKTTNPCVRRNPFYAPFALTESLRMRKQSFWTFV